MMRSLSSAVAGLNTQQTAMDVIGANISNINTVGYKGSRTSFQDVMSQTMQSATGSSGERGGTNAIQIGMGVGLAAVDTITEAGSYQSTGRNTDLAIQKEGYFVVTDGKQQYYTRAGNFDFDSKGNLVIPGSGLFIRGWNALDGRGYAGVRRRGKRRGYAGSCRPRHRHGQCGSGAEAESGICLRRRR